MRTYSTPRSALDGEITKLAILECVASVGLYVGVGVYLGTFKYLAWSVVVAPLMLFRTEASADWGLRLYSGISKRMTLWGTKPGGTSGCVGISTISLTPLVGAAVRIIATVYWAVRRPIHTLKDAPQNWLRQCFCTDFAHPPEIVPLESIRGNKAHIPLFSDFYDDIRNSRGVERALSVVILLPVLIFGWLPSAIYRVSFKATAVAYVPFIWVAHATLRNPLPIKARLERITKGELEKVRRGLSWIILTTLVAKLALVFSWVDRSYVESKFPSQKIVSNFVVLDSWPWWQLTLGADALLTFILLYFADAALARIEGQRPWREESVMTTVATASFLRATMGIVTISHFFYIALVAAAPDSMRHLLTF